MQQLRKDNHYVPKLYLKQWARSGRIWTYRLLVPNGQAPLWKEHSVKGIAFHQHLYTYFAGQEETDEFERWLDSEFENPAEEAISRAISERRLSSEHWNRLFRFAIAQDVRTPARLKEFLTRQRDTLPKLMEHTVRESVAKLESAVSSGVRLQQRISDVAEPLPLKVTIQRNLDGAGAVQAETIVGRRLWLWSMRHLLTNTINKLPPYRWTILHAPANMSWPTTDNPLVRLNFWDESTYNFGGGWNVTNGEIILPLSPKHLLYTCVNRKPPQRGTVLDQKTARLLRKIIVEHADRYVFAQDTTDIHAIRPRVVCLETYQREQASWQNWHSQQCQAEAELLR